MNNEAINIFVSGDYAPSLRVNEVIKRGDYQSLYNDLLPIIQNADIAITNLESPLLEEGQPIKKTGPNLKSPTKSIEAIKFGGFDMVTLANNHMMDYGKEGLFSTIQVCEKNNVRHVGAGSNLEEAKRIEYFDIKGSRIAFINCCENEWSTTQGDYPGCNPLSEVSLFYQIKDAKDSADYVILIIHGGHETYEYPSPRMKQLYRWFIDLGVDAVIGHHTHCFSGYEIYKEKPIVYSLGNFILDRKNKNSSWYQGAAAVISINRGQIGLTLLPFKQCGESVGVYLLGQKETEDWLNLEHKRTKDIQNDSFLDKEFNKFVSRKEHLYRSYLEPNTSKWILVLKNRGLLPKKIKGLKRLCYWNIIRAEAHRDIVLKLLSKEK